MVHGRRSSRYKRNLLPRVLFGSDDGGNEGIGHDVRKTCLYGYVIPIREI